MSKRFQVEQCRARELKDLFSSYTYFTQYEPPERLCIFCGNGARVIVEVGVDRPAGPPLACQDCGPTLEPFVRIAAGVEAARAVKTDVHNWACERLEDRRPAFVVQTDRRVVTLEQMERLVHVPRRMTELEHVVHDAPIDAPRHRAQEDLEPLDVDVVAEEIRRQLIQRRTEAGPERQESTRLDSNDKPWRRLPLPACECALFWKPVERVVDLNRVEHRC